MQAEIYAIRVGRHWVPVTVSHERGQCRVPCRLLGSIGDAGWYVAPGTSDDIARRAARQCDQGHYSTLGCLMADHPEAIRRRDLDA
jgi:hypothetical protein